MTIPTLSVELASEHAWRIYCLMNSAVQGRHGLKTDLERYLCQMATADASQKLAVIGVRYLKLVVELEGKRKRS